MSLKVSIYLEQSPGRECESYVHKHGNGTVSPKDTLNWNLVPFVAS